MAKKKKIVIDLEQHNDNIAIQFSNEVIALMERDGLNSIEALVEICEAHDIAEEDVIELITPKLLSIVTTDSEDLKLLKKPTSTMRLF